MNNLLVNRLDNLEEMDEFLETSLNHKEIENLNRPMIWRLIRNQKSPNKFPGPDGLRELYQTFKEEYQSISNSSKKKKKN